MILPNQHQKDLIERLSQMGLAPSVLRDFSGILPFMFNEQWHNSVSLRKVMRMDNSFTRKELYRISSALSNIYHNTELLERQFKRIVYNRYWESSNTSNWAYRLNWDYIATIIPHPEEEEHHKMRAQLNFERSLE